MQMNIRKLRMRCCGCLNPSTSSLRASCRDAGCRCASSEYPTGREAERVGDIDNIVIRKTYNVGVEIRHDPFSKKGFIVRTAYPFNESPE